MSEFADKVRSLGVLSGGRTRDTRIREGRHHPETGAAWKSTTTEAGTMTEHNTRDARVDAVVTPATIIVTRDSREQAHGRQA